MTAPRSPEPPSITNPPGRAALDRRVAAHPVSLARMRARLGAEDQPLAVRALSGHASDDPAIALLDAWATVADVVSFYSERIADEGYLRTATEPASLRELGRTLGHELRPGVAAQVGLAFTVDDTAGSPSEVDVPRATPVQTVPGPGQSPQVFETTFDLTAHAAWNAIPVGSGEVQPAPSGATGTLWVEGTAPGLRAGDAVAVGTGDAGSLWVVTAVGENPDGRVGWTRLDLARRGAVTTSAGAPSPPVHAFTTRSYLFGWNASASAPDAHEEGATLDVDGDHPEILPSGVVAVEVGGRVVVRTVRDVHADTVAGEVVGTQITRIGSRITRITPEGDVGTFTAPERRGAVVHAGSRALPAARRPLTAPVTGRDLGLAATAPLLPPGRLVVVTGYPVGVAPPRPGTPDAALPPPQAETTRVVSCSADSARPGVMAVAVDPPLQERYDPRGLTVLANVVPATHGETVTQVLGGGDGRADHQEFLLRRAPLTHVRASTATGIRSSLEVRVDDVAWTEVESLADVVGDAHVYAVREQDGTATVAFGDGNHGARLPTGQENVTATYRVGIGPDGDVVPGQVAMLVRRPWGIRAVTNPSISVDAAPRETSDEVRATAPVRVRTLERVVSVDDHADSARVFAGVQAATAATVWDGTQDVVTLGLLGTGGRPVSDALLVDLRRALDAVRDPTTPLLLQRIDVLAFGVQVEMATDPAFRREDVETAVTDALDGAFGQGRWAPATPVTAARALVIVRAVPGILAARLPRLTRDERAEAVRAGAPRPRPGGVDVLEAQTARWEDGEVRPAQVLVLDRDVTFGGLL
ncbi:putative baseplate assembly protein [Actinomycetospora sp. NBRC 106375]|uniref:hypothetical protein n=1 Tax=Actinomycetospora sp. NBRC 106375 TaxID=3032207 RepID=UPI0024A06635|nr:hypothetical protein [Actinomycetospora sp. NBRC 106375]GLZ48198.1 putative baseplate assembly protein [Actinomycetospora sp. NBRC 106375]